MSSSIKLLFFPFAIFFFTNFIIPKASNAGNTNAADIYCFMRNGGNSHEPSWEAAYQSIKNRKQGIFKTSPKQAASFIIEEVVQDPTKYENCIGFLGDLYSTERVNTTSTTNIKTPKGLDTKNSESLKKEDYSERYSY